MSLHGADRESCEYAVLMSVMTRCRKVIECTNQSEGDSVIMRTICSSLQMMQGGLQRYKYAVLIFAVMESTEVGNSDARISLRTTP